MSSFSRINLATDHSRVSASLPLPNGNVAPTPQHMALPSPAQLQQQQQQQQQQQRQYTAPVYNHGPSQQTQGVFTSYPARLLQSEDNALLLPPSYTNNKRVRPSRRDGDRDDSDEDFEEEDSDTGSRMATPGTSTRNRPSNDASFATTGTTSTTTTAATTTSTTGTTDDSGAKAATLLQVGAVKEYMNLPKTMRTRNHVYPTQQDINKAAEMKEVLVPIRLDIDLDDVKLRDVFLWNMNEQFLSPESFGEMLCQDIGLESYRYVPLIAESIRSQVMDFEAIYDIELPMENHIRVIINLDLQVGKVNLRDRFEWDLSNTCASAPEVFSRQMAAELGLGGEYVPIISHAIREQLYRHKRQLVDDYVTDGGIADHLTSAYRNIENANTWTPLMEILSNEELEKLLIAQERNIRRLRRENRFKRTRRRGSLPRKSGSNAGTPS